ncbi:borealin-2 [Embiotoca jacksoni]|uniref:borealin-2 n=1 Tax=Embiotoca jacksoni TaxID=100190 RepID=UPI003703CBA7
MTGGENKMPVRWTRNAEHAQNREELSRDMRRRRLDLFIQQFEKEAQERMNELEAKVENMLATVDKVFKVELMKMPPALQNTLLRSSQPVRGSSVTAKRTQSCLGRKPNDQTRPKLRNALMRVFCRPRSVVSSGDLRCSVVGSAAHITVTTAEGQAVSFSEETKDEINWDLLDDVARCQIQKLKKLMEYLSQRMCKDA